MSIKDKYTVRSIDKEQTYEWLLYKHYLHRIPSISYSFGIFDTNLRGIITFGMPASPNLCFGICGEIYKDIVIELNRLVIDSNDKNVLSYFVMRSINLLPKPKIIVSYAEKDFGHHGYIYQSTNFIYTGLSEKRTDVLGVGHGRHTMEKVNKEDRIWVDRPRKHRYVYFLGNKKQVRAMRSSLNYPIKPYPKGDNKRYDAGYKPTVQGVLF